MTNKEKDFLETITEELEDAGSKMKSKDKICITGFVERLRALTYLSTDERNPVGHP